jgi:LuxR family maltose regulon positive regulatory protein
LGSAEISLVYCQGEMFRGNPAGGRIARAYELFHRSVGRAGEVWCAAFEGPGQVLTGDLDGAEKTYRRATAIGADISGERSPLVAMPALLLASLLYERNELAEATRVLDSYMPFAGSFGLIEQSISAYVTRFRLLDRAGERRAARALALEGMRYADAKGFGRFKAHLVNEQLAAAFREGDVDTGLRLARQHGLDGSNPPFLPAPRVTTGEETLALAWARAALVRGAAATASRALKRWWRHALDRGYRGSVVRVGVVLARALLANGARGEAQRVMREVLATAAATGMVRTVVDEGPVLEGLIAAVAMRPGAAPSRVVDHASRLLEILRAENPDRATPTRTVPAASEEPEPGAPVEPLRWREIEILQRVEAGLLNREIAHELGIAETTVTWHLRTIYQKLGVHRRVHAVARAREFGYL